MKLTLNASDQHFRLTYDGPALQTHAMDVRELAPALLAMGDLLEAATRALHGDRLLAQTAVKASFKTGSFGIEFVLQTNWLAVARDFFAGENATSAANALAILSALGIVAAKGKTGLLAALKWLRGRPITRVERADGAARLIVEDDALPVELDVLALLQDLAVREAIDKLAAPLDRDGIDTLACGTDDAVTFIAGKADRASFYVPPIEDVLLIDETRRMAFSIVSLAFKEDNKWRLYDGAATISATISDAAFLSRVDQNLETFAKGDSLICKVRVRQWQTPAGVRTEYEVVEVLEHRQAGRQIRLPLDQ